MKCIGLRWLMAITCSGSVLAACSADESTPLESNTFSGVQMAWAPRWPSSSDPCWTPEMGRLTRDTALPPCVQTWEPCNGIDDDGDGITDPSCKTMPCTSHRDCTYGGAHIGDDCDWPGGHVCNTIHAPGTTDGSNSECAGVACPPAMVCVDGTCSAPGDRNPGELCVTGADCVLNAGCIPFEEYVNEVEADKRCLGFCHDYDCPRGFVCVNEPEGVNDVPSGMFCRNAAMCAAGATECAEQLDLCYEEAGCVVELTAVATCMRQELDLDHMDALRTCSDGLPGGSPTTLNLLDCLNTTCGQDVGFYEIE